MLFSDKQNCKEVNWNYMAESDACLTFSEFLEKPLHFHLLSALKHQLFSVTVFRLSPSLIYFLAIDSQNILKLLSTL